MDRKLHESLKAITTHISNRYPYLQVGVYTLKFIEVNPALLDTAGVDKYWRCYINKDWFLNLSSEEQVTVILHETMHLIRLHFLSEEKNSERDNIAKDCEINDDLKEMGLKLTSNGMLPEKFDLPDFKTHTYYYENLPKNVGSSGKIHCEGSGVTGVKGPWELDEPRDILEGISEEDAIRLAENIQKNIKNYGSRAAEFIREYNRVIINSIPWMKYFRNSVVRFRGPEFDYSYKRVNNKKSGNIIFPGKIYFTKPKVAIIVDTSGSMDEKQLGIAMACIRQIKIANLEAVVYSGDVDIHSKAENLHNVKLIGGGGTDIINMINNVSEKNIVVITDGYTDWSQKIEDIHKKIVIVLTDGDVKIPKNFTKIVTKTSRG